MRYLFMKRQIHKTLFAIFLIGFYFAQVAQAQTQNKPESHERWYQVEMIIFARPETNQQEIWPKELKLNYPANLMSLGGDGLNLLTANERQLNPQAGTLAKSGSYSLLFHQAWRQKITNQNTHIIINGGKTFNGHQELEGNISISVAQYLKLQTNLWLTQFAPVGTTTNENWPELPTLPNSTFTEADKNTDYVTKRIVKISQQRSMRSNEIHYIDHPLLGIIVKIVPYDAPNQ